MTLGEFILKINRGNPHPVYAIEDKTTYRTETYYDDDHNVARRAAIGRKIELQCSEVHWGRVGEIGVDEDGTMISCEPDESQPWRIVWPFMDVWNAE